MPLFSRFSFLAALFIAVLNFSSASATKILVAHNGTDTNGCGSAVSPCASISFAAGSADLITCADTPAFIPVLDLVQTVTIDCPGAAIGTIGINAFGTRSTVHLRGLLVTGNSSFSADAIEISSGTTVILEDMVISGGPTHGVHDHRLAGLLTIKNSISQFNGGPGVLVAGLGNIVILDDVTLTNNYYGLAVAAGNKVTIARSTISNNGTAGVEADGGSFVVVNGSTITNNTVGIQSGSAIRLSNNDITFNATAVSGATGSFGNNRFSGNGVDGTTLTPVGSASSDLAEK